ncbi:hypothetical protein [Glaciihabitans sp. UYNi722]|uniref:DoxX family protein n=1 Tax=Glaciihabitans sp. UYNi722 TaxID=3156344 RepID=UPI003393CB84
MTAFDIVQIVLRILIAIAFLGMGVNHFRAKPARAMAAMVPSYLKRGGLLTGKNLVRFTGVCEIAGGIGILVPWTAFAAGIALMLFLIAVFPANVYAAEHPEKFGSASIPFWPRYIAQVVLIAVILVAVV